MGTGLASSRSHWFAFAGALTVAASVLVAVPTLAAADAASITCNGLPVTIVGTVAGEEIVGTPGDDVIHGRGGPDVIRGGGGDDVICGGPGRDRIYGESGADVLVGGRGSDRIMGGGGSDTVYGGPGADRIRGAAGADDLSGGDGSDMIFGGSGVDTLKGRLGGDSLVGGDQEDVANGGGGEDACDAEAESSCELEPLDFSVGRVYVTQSVPAADSADAATARVATLEGRAGMVRVFLTATRLDEASVPDLRLHWRDGDGVRGSVLLERTEAVPMTADEGSLADTFNFTFDASFLDEGMDIYIDVDPGGAVAESDETNNRWPAAGWYDLGVVAVPSFDVTFVPMTVNGVPAVVDQTIAEDLLEDTLAVMPIATHSIEIHAPVTYNGSDWVAMLDLITQTRLADGSSRIYVGIVAEQAVSCCTGGIGWIGWGASVSLPRANVVAHELGHNLGLHHAPCGGPGGVDEDYPYGGGLIGTWGYDIGTGQLKDPATHRDLMTYCSTTWISDFNYDNALGFQTAQSGYSEMTSVGENDVVVAFTGMIGEAGSSHGAGPTRIVGATVVDAAPVLPQSGDYRLVGVDGDGAIVNDVSFQPLHIEMPEAGLLLRFAFSVPIDAGVLASVVAWQLIDADGDVVASRDAA